MPLSAVGRAGPSLGPLRETQLTFNLLLVPCTAGVIIHFVRRLSLSRLAYGGCDG